MKVKNSCAFLRCYYESLVQLDHLLTQGGYANKTVWFNKISYKKVNKVKTINETNTNVFFCLSIF